MQFVKAWPLEELNKSLGVGLEGNRNFTNGRNMFGAATCFACHRFNGEGGGVGPDLSTVAGKFSPRDLLEVHHRAQQIHQRPIRQHRLHPPRRQHRHRPHRKHEGSHHDGLHQHDGPQ